ncbi:group 1 glycosyl transferase [Paenibacillus mucilaginosus 3016]|uniref:Group 1 glycosyl transferase n=1 Tax=Paenibacillus mucilaginosus 3016 TaxID=1116391 RepID=H6NE27_9BACL|nr:glycosyltransferase [Paenibacillus mucilaginosus]AFC32980.1 group 1 glycosyl transferase [Paenibacillus mucilaginosus 3016]
MKHILYIQPYASQVGGVDTVLLQLVEGLDRSRYRAFVLLPGPSPYVAKYEAAGATVLFGQLAVFGKPTDLFYYPRNLEVVKEFGVKPDKIAVIPHGHYQGVYGHQGKNYREIYGIPEDGYVYLFIGAIKPYKGVQQLVESFNRIKSANTYLVVAGKPSKEMEEVLSRYQGQQNIVMDLRFIPDEEVADIISMCDSFVLPFQEITTSGSAILALSFKKPIVIPKTPFVDEYFTPEIASIYDPSKGELLEDAMKKVQKVDPDQVEPVYEHILARLDWKNIAMQLSEIYQNRPAPSISRALDKG